MRLFKYIGILLLLVLVSGFSIKISSFFKQNSNSIYVDVENINSVGSLIKDLDKELSNEINTNAYNLVKTAYKEIGNEGGEKFWRWCGFTSEQPWCSCFVTWCADQNGFIEKGIIPWFTQTSYGASWFMSRNQWLCKDEIPTAGMIVFFDYTNMNLEYERDGISDHVGIVEKVEDGYIYCIEGNYKNTCAENMYELADDNILGYGTPNY